MFSSLSRHLVVSRYVGAWIGPSWPWRYCGCFQSCAIDGTWSWLGVYVSLSVLLTSTVFQFISSSSFIKGEYQNRTVHLFLRLFCFGLGFYILVCVFRVLVAVPLFPIGLVTSLIMIFAASRIWSIGEDIVDRLVPHNLTSAILKGDPAPIPRRPEFPQFHRHLNQTEYNLICRPEAFPGSGILKALDTEDSTDSSAPDGDFSDHGKETSFGLGHSALGFGQSLFGLGHLDTLFSPSDGSGDRWETLPQDRSHPREESQDSLPTRGDLGSFEVEKRDRMRRPTIPIRQSQFIRTVSEAESKSSAPEDLINNESSQFLPDPELPEPRPPTRRTRGFRHLPSRVGRSSAGVRSSLNQGRWFFQRVQKILNVLKRTICWPQQQI